VYTVTTLHGSTGNLITVIDPQEHAQRRKIWDRSMNTSALLGYRDMLSARITQLVQQLEKRQGSETDLAWWLSCLSYVIFRLLGVELGSNALSCAGLISWVT